MKQTCVAAFLFQQTGDHFVKMTFAVLQPIDLVINGLGNALELSDFEFVEPKELFAFGKDEAWEMI